MPEGPECQRMAALQHDFWKGKTLSEIKVHSGRYKNKPESIQPIIEKLPLKVISVKVKGKFIYWILRDNNFNLSYIFQTLGMSGQWYAGGHTINEFMKDVRYEFVSSQGSTIYCDRRNFGTLKFVEDPEALDAKLNSLGADVLSNEWITLEEFKEKFTLKKRGQKTLPQLLMDQSILCGIGNYLKSEILWVSSLSPYRTPDSLNEEEWAELWRFSHFIPKESSWRGKGSSVMSFSLRVGREIKDPYNIPDYSSENGSLAVYRRKFDPLGNEVIREKTADKRTTHWVPGHQK